MGLAVQFLERTESLGGSFVRDPNGLSSTSKHTHTKITMKLFAILGLVALAVAEPTVYFQERFDSGDLSQWVNSEHKDDLGKFEVSAGKFYGDAEKDKGAQTSQDAKFYAMSAKFDKFSNKDKKTVVQFTVKHEQNIDCGGGYVKVFPSTLDQKDMHGESPYNIMFGPDICGPGTKKVHVIFSHKGKNHLVKKDIRCKDDVFTHLYTLILDAKDHSYEVLIDNESVEKGLLTDDWDMLPAKKIKDPEAKKPSQEEWDEREKIDDPEDTKPEDWDKPEQIPDPDATKPEDWDDDMDGDWEPAQIDNPEYKGKWVHPEIDNPEYDAAEEATLGVYEDFGAIGLDLWQVKSGTIFDNFLITDDPEYAKKVGEETFGETKDAEKKMKDEQDEVERKKAEEEAKKAEPEEADEDDEDDDEDDEEELEENKVEDDTVRDEL